MLERLLCQRCLQNVSKPSAYFVRFGHTPKRPRTAGPKILITEHRFSVPLPQQTPAYVTKTVSEETSTEIRTPHKFHVVTRLNCQVIWQERRILNDLGLLGPVGVTKILMNIPSVNKDLWKVKHAVLIQPLKIHGEIPDSQEGFQGGRLLPDGTYTFFKPENADETMPVHSNSRTIPTIPLHPYELAKLNYQPFYYNYREDS